MKTVLDYIESVKTENQYSGTILVEEAKESVELSKLVACNAFCKTMCPILRIENCKLNNFSCVDYDSFKRNLG